MKKTIKSNKLYALHARNGLLLKFAETSLADVRRVVEGCYGRSSPEWQQLNHAIKRLGMARNKLDGRLGREMPDVDAEVLNNFYYGKE